MNGGSRRPKPLLESSQTYTFSQGCQKTHLRVATQGEGGVGVVTAHTAMSSRKERRVTPRDSAVNTVTVTHSLTRLPVRLRVLLELCVARLQEARGVPRLGRDALSPLLARGQGGAERDEHALVLIQLSTELLDALVPLVQVLFETTYRLVPESHQLLQLAGAGHHVGRRRHNVCDVCIQLCRPRYMAIKY